MTCDDNFIFGIIFSIVFSYYRNFIFDTAACYKSFTFI